MSALGLTTRYSLERRTCGCTMHVSATGRFVLAADYDALITRLRAAESERDDLRCEVEALQAERDTARVAAGRLRESLRVLNREHDALITRLRAAEARTAPVAVQLFTDQIDADRVALDWTADVPAESMPDRSTWRLEQGLGRVTATWSTRDGRRSLAMLAVIVRDDFNHSVLVTVPLPAAPEAP